MKALLITLLAGCFFLVGSLIARFAKDKKGIIPFSLGMAFSVMLMLMAIDILPEVNEMLEGKNKIYMYVFIVIGIVLLKLIDMLVPHHDHEKEKKHHERHLEHIGLISSLALIIHNIIEGMSIYSLALVDSKLGIIMALGVGLHNIPFGIEITAALEKANKNVILNIIVLTLSTLLGAVVLLVFGEINGVMLASLMSITIGMIIYLLMFELLPELNVIKEKKYKRMGLITGFILMVINIFIGG